MFASKEKIKVKNPEALDSLSEKETANLLAVLERVRRTPYVRVPTECVVEVLSSGKFGPRVRIRHK